MRKYIGTKQFYLHVLKVAIPMAVQQAITNFVGVLDNIMIGQTSTYEMSGVSIVNQILFVFYLCVFGGMSGIGIFTAQFYGAGNTKGVRYTFRFKILTTILIVGIGILIFLLCGSQLISLYLTAEDAGSIAFEIISHGQNYLWVMLIGLLPFTITEAYTDTLRGCGDTVIPMIASIVAVFTNLILNYILIFGKFGVPALGVTGAAIATVISRFIEMFIVVLYTHTHTRKHTFIRGAFRSFYVPWNLTKQMITRGFPLLLNETLWAGGTAIISACYASLGVNVIPAQNIANAISSVCNISFITMGCSIAIILGQELGAGVPTVREDADKLTLLCIIVCACFGGIMVLFAPLFPQIYNTEETVRSLATSLIILQGIFMPVYGFETSEYYVLRSGGKVWITFLFDSGFVWLVSVPVAWLLVNFANLPFLIVYVLVQLLTIVKCIIGFIMVKKGIWVNNLTTI